MYVCMCMYALVNMYVSMYVYIYLCVCIYCAGKNDFPHTKVSYVCTVGTHTRKLGVETYESQLIMSSAEDVWLFCFVFWSFLQRYVAGCRASLQVKPRSSRILQLSVKQ